jgi:hypothetical protein
MSRIFLPEGSFYFEVVKSIFIFRVMMGDNRYESICANAAWPKYGVKIKMKRKRILAQVNQGC